LALGFGSGGAAVAAALAGFAAGVDLALPALPWEVLPDGAAAFGLLAM
jgi:hypothetical protein